MANFKELKQKYKEFYDFWRRDGSFSPALKAKVNVSRRGWNHITNHRRNISDVKRRLRVLPLVKKIIDRATTYQNIRLEKKFKFYELSSVEKIAVKGKNKYIIIKIVIFEDQSGRKTFLSVMPDKVGRVKAY